MNNDMALYEHRWKKQAKKDAKEMLKKLKNEKSAEKIWDEIWQDTFNNNPKNPKRDKLFLHTLKEYLDTNQKFPHFLLQSSKSNKLPKVKI